MKTGISDSGLNLTHDRFAQLPVPVPPLQVQRRVVDLLDDHLSRLAAADAYLGAAQRRHAVLHGQILTSELGAIPTNDVSLGQLLVAGLSNGKSVPTKEGGFPVLRLTALRDGRIDLAERKEGAWTADGAARFLVQRGDFLISRGNGSLRLVGRGGLVDQDPDAVAFPDTLIRARPDAGRLLPGFMALVWHSPAVRGQIEASAKTTAGIYKINQKDLGAIRLPLPSLDDQQRILESVSSSRDRLAALSRGVEKARTRSAGLQRSLLVAAFSGRLTGDSADFEQDQEVVG